MQMLKFKQTSSLILKKNNSILSYLQAIVSLVSSKRSNGEEFDDYGLFNQAHR